ncbi:RlpA-like protein [Rickettsia rhipicephali]|uniref:septal ring lytic transglycosylase RlpA family protein n=1 Tax=Rickettsia rhipicephali TaxID=33992 RepID=UPI00070E8A71|nr:septal ring lytic transglycosylase RlpA family protein [Rickettsia rhipicephali]ALN41408.1 RlpA-like protein [Rickettsia rhipicephali]
MIIVKNHKFKLDLLQNKANKEKFEGNTARSTAAYTLVCEDTSTGLTYTADISKVGNQISGEPAQRIKIREHRRIPKFDVPNLEVSKVYKLPLGASYAKGLLLLLIFCFGLSGCNTSKRLPYSHKYSYKELSKDDPHNLTYKGHYKVGKNYKIKGKTYKPHNPKSFTETGYASWYGGRKDSFHGKKTANGDRFNRNLLTAAHKTLPLPCLVKVTNKANNKAVILMVNDRGPFKKNRIIDVSQKAAEILAFKNQGITKVKIEYLPNETEKFLKNINLKKPQSKTLAKNSKKSSSTKVTKNNKCSVNCHIKLVNLKYKLVVNP